MDLGRQLAKSLSSINPLAYGCLLDVAKHIDNDIHNAFGNAFIYVQNSYIWYSGFMYFLLRVTK